MRNKPVLTIPEAPSSANRTTQKYVFGRLRHAIMIGAILPGTALTLRRLADTMGLSPTPVREAAGRLSSENAILVKLNRRIVIPDMTLGRFEELVELRIVVETYAATRALPFVFDVKIEKMKVVDGTMDKALAKKIWIHGRSGIRDFNTRFTPGIQIR